MRTNVILNHPFYLKRILDANLILNVCVRSINHICAAYVCLEHNSMALNYYGQLSITCMSVCMPIVIHDCICRFG